MAVKTSFLELEKPEYPDAADISVLNANMDILDTAIQKVTEPASNWKNISVFQVNGELPDDTTSAVPSAVRPCLICSRNGSMALYW